MKCIQSNVPIRGGHVVPHEGTWIEILMACVYPTAPVVVPHEGTWIEIGIIRDIVEDFMVVPHEGTWIEMLKSILSASISLLVVPHEGTWIEITQRKSDAMGIKSFPTRERGLK